MAPPPGTLRVSRYFLALFVILIDGSLPSIRAFGWDFLRTAEWDPVGERFGALVPIYGTLLSSLVALLIAVPVSFGIGLFLTELAPNFLKGPLGVAIELLAAIPSIIYGMWGLFVFCPFFARTAEPWLIERLGPLPMIGPLFRGAPIGISVLAAIQTNGNIALPWPLTSTTLMPP